MRSPSRSDVASLIGVSALLGSAFLAIRVGVRSLPPATLTAARLVLATALLATVLRIRGMRLWPDARRWVLPFWIGLLGSAAPYFLISWAEQSIPSGTAAILIATGPLLALILSHLSTRDDRITARKLVGVLLGLAGVGLVFGADAISATGAALAPELAVVGAALGYALAGVLTRRVPPMDPLVLTTLALGWGAALCLPVALWVDRPWTLEPDAISLLALVYLALIPTALAFLIRFRLIMNLGYTFVSFGGYLVPIFGVAWGWLLLGERLPASTLAALALILAGLTLARLSRGAELREMDEAGGDSLPSTRTPGQDAIPVEAELGELLSGPLRRSRPTEAPPGDRKSRS